jgi:hypothetical protein
MEDARVRSAAAGNAVAAAMVMGGAAAAVRNAAAAAAAGRACLRRPDCLGQLLLDLAACSQVVGHLGITWGQCASYVFGKYQLCLQNISIPNVPPSPHGGN